MSKLHGLISQRVDVFADTCIQGFLSLGNGNMQMAYLHVQSAAPAQT